MDGRRNQRTEKTWVQRLSTRGVALLMIQLVSILVLIINLSITVFAMSKRNTEQQNFVDVIPPNGKWSCDQVRQYNRWMHFGINALSITLLGASNYCAQLLVAPTRSEVNKAHRNRTWLDIGVQSTRNLRKTNVRRRYLWILLMLTSGLLHLL
jgi:hypothetical protein